MLLQDNPEYLNFFGEDTEFDHVGIAVRSIKDNIANSSEICSDPVQNVKVAFAYMNNFRVELVEPLNENSPVSNILNKGQSIYHICFRVGNIDEAIRSARDAGFHCIAPPVIAKAFNKKIAWVFSRTYGLIELLEK